MRKYAFAIAAAAVFAFSASQAVGMGSRGVQAEGLHQGGRSTGRSVGHQDCRELRKACLNQQGQGNCQRYRRSCGLE
jgi:hypothetical protein